MVFTTSLFVIIVVYEKDGEAIMELSSGMPKNVESSHSTIPIIFSSFPE